MIVCLKTQYQDFETEAAKWNPALINRMIYTCALPSVACQNVFCEKEDGDEWNLFVMYWVLFSLIESLAPL